MSKITLLDCTLRDGGYINKWHFGRDVIRSICAKLDQTKMDIIEVGFLSGLAHTEDDSLYSDCAQIDAVLGGCSGVSRIAAMIAIGEMELDPATLAPAADCGLDIVRITFHGDRAETDKAFRYARCLMEKGYDVCMQPVGTTAYTDRELLELIGQINELEPYAFYLVDTLGLLQHRELMHFIDLIDHNLAPAIRLGFHSHNNLQMSYANAQSIIEYNAQREFILDCSVYGMGRGAGNLCTELAAQYMNSLCAGRYEMMPVYEILDDYIYPIYTRTSWGYNVHYYVAAIRRCHPNYAAFLMNKQTLTMNEVDLILRNIPQQERYIYNKQLIGEMYYNFQNHNIDDERARARLQKEIGGRDVLLLAPGKSLTTYREKLEQFIEEQRPAVIAINAAVRDLPSNFVFVSNLKRLYMLDTERLHVPVILTSNLPNIVQGGICVDYAGLCDRSREETDNSGVMLVRLMEKLGLQRVYIAGFDGFRRESEKNYFEEKMINSVDPGDIVRKNQSIARQLREIRERMEIVTLTPSAYWEA